MNITHLTEPQVALCLLVLPSFPFSPLHLGVKGATTGITYYTINDNTEPKQDLVH